MVHVVLKSLKVFLFLFLLILSPCHFLTSGYTMGPTNSSRYILIWIFFHVLLFIIGAEANQRRRFADVVLLLLDICLLVPVLLIPESTLDSPSIL